MVRRRGCDPSAIFREVFSRRFQECHHDFQCEEDGLSTTEWTTTEACSVCRSSPAQNTISRICEEWRDCSFPETRVRDWSSRHSASEDDSFRAEPSPNSELQRKRKDSSDSSAWEKEYSSTASEASQTEAGVHSSENSEVQTRISEDTIERVFRKRCLSQGSISSTLESIECEVRSFAQVQRGKRSSTECPEEVCASDTRQATT